MVTLHLQEALVQDTLADNVHALTYLEKTDTNKTGEQQVLCFRNMYISRIEDVFLLPAAELLWS